MHTLRHWHILLRMGKASRRRRDQPASSQEDEPDDEDDKINRAWLSMYSMPGRIDKDELVDAANDGNEVRVCALLEAGANPNRPHVRSHWSPLACAARHGHAFILQQLLNHNADPRSMAQENPLVQACTHGRVDCVRRLLNANAPLDWPDEDGWIPLYTACANQQLSCLRLLLTAKADPDMYTQGDGCCLQLTPSSKPQQVGTGKGQRPAQLWQEIGAADKAEAQGLQLKKPFFFTSLCISSENGSTEFVKLLLRAKASVDLPISGDGGATARASDTLCLEGVTPLMLAAQNCEAETMQLLVDAHASLDATNCQGYTALHLASGWSTGKDSDREDAIRLLIKAGSSLQACDLFGRTAFDVAASRERMDEMAVLIDAGAAPLAEEDNPYADGVLRGALEAGILLPTMGVVQFTGLQSHEALNGSSGTLLHWKPVGAAWDGGARGSGRWAVCCNSDGESRLFKAENLVIVASSAGSEEEEEECPVCCEPIPVHGDRSTDHKLMPCCGKILCGQCGRNLERHASGETPICVLCRQPWPTTPAEARPLLEKRAAAGHPHAKMLLSFMYGDGEDVKRDQALATRYLKEASEAGFIPAQVALGGVYMGARDGRYIIETDPEKGFKLLFEAAVQGSPMALTSLSRFAMRGDNPHCFQPMCPGEEPNQDLCCYLSILLLHRAAELGDHRAALRIKQAMSGTTVDQAKRENPQPAADREVHRIGGC